MTKYTTISLPKKFIQKVNDFIVKNPDSGYSSVAEFVKDAIRSHLKEISHEKENFSQEGKIKA